MNDNYYIDDLIGALKRDIVTERYYPLIDYKGELTEILNKYGIVRKDHVTDDVIEKIRMKLGDTVTNLFVRYIHIYDFNKSKLRDIKAYVGTKEYDVLAALISKFVFKFNNSHQAIISKDIFDAVQEEKLKRSNVVIDENGYKRSSKKYSSKKHN